MSSRSQWYTKFEYIKISNLKWLHGVMCADVTTDVVGKYCYYLDMPLEDKRIPVIVDVALIGRTKIIKVHSALWLEVCAFVHPRLSLPPLASPPLCF